VRLAAVLTEPLGPPPKRSFWSRAWRAFVGLGPEEDEDAPRFVRPFGVSPGADGSLVVADADAAFVVRTREAGTSTILSCEGTPWNAPLAVATSAEGDAYVVDGGAGVVVRVDAHGRCTRLGEGALERPTSVAVGAGRIFVADPPRHHVAVLSSEGALVATIGAHGEGEGELNFPTGVALDGQDNLLVVDALNFRIARFSPDGRWLGALGAPLADGGQFAMPKAVAVGDDGRIYVSDAQRDVIVVFMPDGTFDYSFGASGGEPGRFTHPAGIAVARGRVYVADSYAARVQAFEVLGVTR
jgi:sugar lactone lactonase YvrE